MLKTLAIASVFCYYEHIRRKEIMSNSIILTTTDFIPGREVTQILGLVKGSTIQTRHIGSHFLAGLRTVVGGEVKGYVAAVNNAREEATQRMQDEATALGADAIISLRYSTSQVMNGAAEILVYGTAVKL
jgi:uncharacterized protein YbjQ (UPF0145 family)